MNYNQGIKKMYQNIDVNAAQNTEQQLSSPLFTTDYMQGILRSGLGFYVICEFLIGTQEIVTKKGYLVNSGINFFTLYDPEQKVYIVCDMYSLKFIYFTEYQNMEYVTNYEQTMRNRQ